MLFICTDVNGRLFFFTLIPLPGDKIGVLPVGILSTFQQVGSFIIISY
jgi:hypothetical protein